MSDTSSWTQGPPVTPLGQPDGAGLLQCPFCGSPAALCKWLDTLEPNATWIECTNGDCGILTDSFHHEYPEQAKALAIAVWNRRVK